ncbi:hypothetical protein TPER_HE00335 [Candidatus Hoaglandella endobia]|uniref:Uncharacterized protein n=1 Tax=Candidatus Hoaglandella endobia TaxID=1778263 RepID=A0A143WU70_9ENTR|nr:hypothetical protein TPER_HE00335 [Candidatus Hoaglandella endobia]
MTVNSITDRVLTQYNITKLQHNYLAIAVINNIVSNNIARLDKIFYLSVQCLFLIYMFSNGYVVYVVAENTAY